MLVVDVDITCRKYIPTVGTRTAWLEPHGVGIHFVRNLQFDEIVQYHLLF